MKVKNLLILLMCMCFLQSCATVFGGAITDCQRHKPDYGEPKRKVRPVALAADIITYPVICLPIDFITGAIYKPCPGAVTAYNGDPKMPSFSGNDYSIKGENELYLSDGVVSMNQIRGWVGPPALGGYISLPHLQTGAVFVTYRHFLSERFALGMAAGIDNEDGDISYGNPKLTGIESNAVSGHYNVHAYSLSMEALLVYTKTEKNLVYGYLGIGATYFDDKCVIFANAPYGSPVSLPSNPYYYRPTVYNFQVTPIGVRFGGKCACFAELGFGYKGILSGGLSVNL
jgi:hypothetical protein